MKFIHLSDLHINTAKKDENKQLKPLYEHFIKRYNGGEKPAILITGDLVDNGQADEYGPVENFLHSLKEKGFELIVCPGNHDYGKGGIHYRDDSSKLFFKKIECGLLGYTGDACDMASLYPKVTPFDDDKVVFFGIDSLAGKMDNPGNLHLLADGEIGKKQRNRLLDHLAKPQYDGHTKIVYLHNHPWELIPGHGLVDGLEFIREIDGQVDIICFGHMHASHFWESREDMVAMNAGKTTAPINYRGSPYLTYREISVNHAGTAVGVIKVPAAK